MHRQSGLLYRAIDLNDFSLETISRLEALKEAIPNEPIRALDDPAAPDALLWNDYLAPYLGQNWLEIPWLVEEFYFFRRILEATGYFRAGDGQGLDPYEPEKQQGLDLAIERLEIPRAPDPKSRVRMLLMGSLWGNQADFSMWAANSKDQPTSHAGDNQAAHILVDDADRAIAVLETGPQAAGRIDIITDNAGAELLADLLLVDGLLQDGWTEAVRLHMKPYPTFISDATEANLRHMLWRMREAEHDALPAIGRRLEKEMRDGRLQVKQDTFWVAPLAFWEIPPGLRGELAQASLIISKGDANYRRLLGDRHWDFSTPFTEIVSYMPAPLLALRTLKSNVAAGIPAEQLAAFGEDDQSWMINGEWAVRQFAPAAS